MIVETESSRESWGNLQDTKAKRKRSRKCGRKDNKFRETAQWPEKPNNPKRENKKNREENSIEIVQENVSELEDVCL